MRAAPVPVGMPEVQIAKRGPDGDLAHALLKTGLSQQGYATASAIIQLEDVLRAIENSTRFARSPLDYQFTIFGTPGATGAWAWRVEGHHLSLHFAVSGGRVVSTLEGGYDLQGLGESVDSHVTALMHG